MFPIDWYWLAADGRLYSSARQSVVTETDAAYAAWCERGEPGPAGVTGQGDEVEGGDQSEAAPVALRRPTQWPSDEAGAQTLGALQAVLDVYGLSASLDDLKTKLKARVDADAENLRLGLITPGSGQAMEYQEAYAEAARVAAALEADGSTALDPEAFPMLAASIGSGHDPKTEAPSTDIASEARAVCAAYDAYQRAGAAIRAARLTGKAAIDAARSVKAARAAYDAIAWPDLSG